ncbi:MAG TPA: Gfo/Idh/MocA family oxidoreductase [Polyangiaceae bacterium]
MRSKRNQVRYAVIGAGNIAQVAVLPAFEHASENSRLVALISGDPAKRASLRKRHKLEHTGSYEELESVLEQAEIDAVYVATPNSQHREFTERAARCGVHVLCEKPLAPSLEDCHAMMHACEENSVKLMVAYRLHFEEATLKAFEIARSGKLGELRLFDSFFTHVVKPNDIRRDPEPGGGASFDLGVYCINAARNLFEAEPISVFAAAVERNGVDDTTTVVLRFPQERLAQFCISNSTSGVSSYRVAGSKGDLRVEPAYEYAEGLVHYLTIKEETRRTAFRKRDQFAPEIIHFSKAILEDQEPGPSAEEGSCDVRVVEAILESMKTGKTVDLAPYQRLSRPTLAQERHKPAISKPSTVNAPSPSVR